MAAQGFNTITINTPLKDSLAPLLNNDEAAITTNAGVEFPSNPLEGMQCYRVDEEKLYQYRSGEWQCLTADEIWVATNFVNYFDSFFNAEQYSATKLNDSKLDESTLD